MLRDRFKKWHIDTKNARGKRRRLAIEARSAVASSVDGSAAGVLTDDNLLTHTVAQAERVSGRQLLQNSRSSTPDHPLFAESGPLREILHGIANFYTAYSETHEVLSFRDAGSSSIIDFTNDLTHALDVINKYETPAGWQLLHRACHLADDCLKVSGNSHPDSLVYLLKFLVYVSTSGHDRAERRICEYLTQLSICRLGSSHPIALLCSCLLYTSPSPRDGLLSRMPSSA